MQQLFAFYKPGLEADKYKILAEQQVLDGKEMEVKPGVQPWRIYNHKSASSVPQPQYFEVVAPQFTLPANSVHSHYPPNGHQDEGRVLPHLILQDPART